VQNNMLTHLHVRKSPTSHTQGLLIADGRVLRCALGRSGIGIKRGEGDGITPLGSHRLVEAYIRVDRVPFRASHFPLSTIEENDGWCDAEGDANYNCHVELPYPASHERMMRDDHLYDVVVVMDHNVTRRMTIGGSAIFFHLAHDDYRPTEGCVAISRKDMLWLLPQIGPDTVMVVE